MSRRRSAVRESPPRRRDAPETTGGARPARARGRGAGRPYSAQEAADLLGVSHDSLTRHYETVHGFRLGARVLFPRWAVDRLVADPAGSVPSGAGGPVGPREPEEAPAVERVLALLPLLSSDELRRVARAVLAREVA